MQTRALSTPSTVLVFGADDRVHALGTLHERIRTYASHHRVGARSRRRAEAALRAGTVACVVLFTRWAGHTDTGAIKALCRARGIAVHVVTTGFATARDVIAGILSTLTAR
jgi:hypothetical protein